MESTFVEYGKGSFGEAVDRLWMKADIIGRAERQGDSREDGVRVEAFWRAERLA